MGVREELSAAVKSEILYSDICLGALESILGDEAVAFNIAKGVHMDESGTTTSQEVAALTRTKLVLWFSEEVNLEEAEGLPHPSVRFETHVRIIPLDRISEINLRSAYSADGTLHGTSALVVLRTQDISRMDQEQPGIIQIYHDTLRFSKTSEEREAFDRCVEFNLKLAALLN